MGFNYGSLGNGSDKGNGGYVRAVCGGQSVSFGNLVIGSFDSWGAVQIEDADAAGSFIDNNDGTVTDTSTGLMWQQAHSSSTMSWEQALAYCEDMVFAGYTDWQLPTIKELRSLPAYLAMIPFKLTQAAIAQSGVYLCDPATVSDELTIHLPDVLLPDGITRMWLDLTYSQVLSTNGVCFYVSNYGVVAK